MAHPELPGHPAGFHPPGFRGPKCWVVSAVVGLALGLLWGWGGWLIPAAATDHARAGDTRVKEFVADGTIVERLPSGETLPWSDTPPSVSPDAVHPSGDAHDAGKGRGHAPAPSIPLVLCLPFALLLGSIALMPFINARFWHDHYPDFAFLLGGVVAGFYLMAYGGYGRHALLHSLIEYYSFIALIGGLFVVSGGILIHVNAKATPFANTVLLACGAVLANIVGTTGASMLLIRPFMRMNAGRLKPIHIVMFIFIVSNCAGCLTPIGDPPLYLGYLKGVPFEWTLIHLWPMWLMCVGLLLALFFVIDSRLPRAAGAPALPEPTRRRLPVSIRGGAGGSAFICLGLMVLGVFIDPMLKKFAGVEGIPVGATFQLIVAGVAYRLANVEIHEDNAFTFHPVKEVAMLFVGIFLTMIPALGYLSANAGSLGVETPTQFYFFTGGLSAVLDNAPTYLNFGQAALGLLHLPLNADGLARFIAHEFEVVHTDGGVSHFKGVVLLEAISLAAVFFGAMTYIGNGPNFMVKSISEAAGVRMPSFFAYFGYACLLLLPILIAVWAVFIR
jgi:Na+/H+ antiporter NhaD/arsenite permease-like protein